MRKYIPWNWEDMPLSKSMVHMMSQCAYRFKLQFIEEKPIKKTGALARGNRVHEILEKVYKRMEEKSFEEFQRVMGDLPWSRMDEDDVVIVRRFWELQKDRWKILSEEGQEELFFPVATEMYLEDRELWYYGTFDRLDMLEGGGHLVIDYKTGKYHKWLKSKYRNELAGYQHLINHNKVVSSEVTHGCIVFLGVEPVKIVLEKIKSVTQKAFYRGLDRTRDKCKKYRKSGFPKNVGPLCNWCPFQVECMADNGQVD